MCYLDKAKQHQIDHLYYLLIDSNYTVEDMQGYYQFIRAYEMWAKALKGTENK